MRTVTFFILGIACLSLTALAQTSQITQSPNTIIIKNHQFEPVQLSIPAGQKIRLTVENQDPTVEEFESFDLNREKVVSGNKSIIVFIGPLKPGLYKYFGDFHQKTAQGVIIAQ